MTQPTGVFVRLPLSDNEKMALTSGVKMGGSIEQGILAIGTPVTGSDIPVVTSLGTLRDPVPCVRQSDAQSAIAALEAEVGRLRGISIEGHEVTDGKAL